MAKLPSWKYQFRDLHLARTVGDICAVLTVMSPTRVKILRHILVEGQKTAYSLGKALKLRPFLAGRSLTFLQRAGLVKFEEEKPWRTGKKTRVFGLTLRGFLVGINSYGHLFEVDETSGFKAAEEWQKRLPGLRTIADGLETTAQLFVKLKSLTTGRTVGEEIENAIQFHGHLIPLISSKWNLFRENGVDHIAKASMLVASNCHVFWGEAEDESTLRGIDALVYERLKKGNALHLLEKFRQDEFTTSFLMLDIGAVDKRHILPYLEASIGSARFDVEVTKSELASFWFSVIAKDKELRERVLQYVSLRVDALTNIRQLLSSANSTTLSGGKTS